MIKILAILYIVYLIISILDFFRVYNKKNDEEVDKSME